jgi:integration host factor subunit alpha
MAPKSLTKARIVDGVRDTTGLPRVEADDLVEALVEVLKEAIEQGESIKVSGFGSFLVRTKSARIGRNPQTGEAITLPRRRVLTFKPSRLLRDAMSAAAKLDEPS